MASMRTVAAAWVVEHGALIVTLARFLWGLLITGLSLLAMFMLGELINKGFVPMVSQEIQRLIFQPRY
jgi:hypothetical protein